MAVYHTVDGQPYSVTAGTDVTVTDADGLILGVSAGGQGSFVGNGGDVTITGEHHFVQIKGGGGGGGNGGGGGGGEPFDGNLPNNDLRVGELGGDKKIYLNGLEIMQESTVIVDVVEANNANAVTSNAVFNAIQDIDVNPAPVPEPLGTTTTLKHGHVYTLAVAGDTDLSALSVELYGTAELWVDYTAGSVTWPQLWSWVDGIVPTFAAGNRYFVRVWSDGHAVIAELKYSYTNV